MTTIKNNPDGKKLTLFLIDGTDNSPRTITIGNWSGKAINSPRANLPEMIKRDEYDNPGIYILKTDPDSDTYNEKIYIGESENIRERLINHLKNDEKDFNECIVFISNDDLLTKSHIKYIESRLVSLAKKANNSEIDQNQPSLTTLSEADISDMEYFIEQIKIILPTVGYNFLLSNRIDEKLKDDKSMMFNIKSNKFEASMQVTSEGFVVLEGSQASLSTSDSISRGWKRIREKLKSSSILQEKEDHYIFTEDAVFDSTSAAASVVLGRQESGPRYWKNKDGITYKEFEKEKLD